MGILIGSARHDENGKYVGGKAGDQKQKLASDGLDHSGEVSVQNFYVPKKGLVILRAKDPNLANGLAFCMAIACNNKNIGYGQDTRYGVYQKGILTDVPVNGDCSELIRACIKACGHTVPDFNTETEPKVLVKSGLFEEVPYTKQSELYNGDICCTKTKGHTFIIISGAKSRTIKRVNPYTEPRISVTSVANAKAKGITQYIARGGEVMWVQFELKEWGADLGKAGIDGDCGPATVNAIKAFQKAHGLQVDGVCGPLTRRKLKET